MKRIFAVFALLTAIVFVTRPASADPFLSVTANHLGGGAVQYTLNANNDLGGAIAVQITAAGNIVQGLSIFSAPEAGAPDGGADKKVQADAADAVGAMFGLPAETYNAFNGDGGLDPGGNGGSVWDSWWDDTGALTTNNPPFNSVIGDAAVGGNIGSTEFSFSAASAGGTNIAFTRIGQIVILDPSAAGLPVGDVTPLINSVDGFAQLDIIDVFDVGPDMLPGLSTISAVGQNFSITDTFFIEGMVMNLPPVAVGFPLSGEIDVDASIGAMLTESFMFTGPEPGDPVTVTVQDLDNAASVGLSIMTMDGDPATADLNWTPGLGLIGSSFDLLFDFQDSFGATGQQPLTINVVPEPSSFMLAGLGLIGLVAFGWRRRTR